MNWEKCIKTEFEKLEHQKKGKIVDLWNKNRELFGNDKPSACCHWNVKNLTTNKKNVQTIVKDRAQIKQNCAFIEMTKVTPLPKMTMWVLTRRNILANRDESSNIPYLRDDIIDDDIFVDLVRALIPFQSVINTSKENQKECPDEIIFQSISSYLCGKTNANDLREKYMKLTKNPSTPPNPNIAEFMEESLTRDQALRSYRRLFCRRCLIYNCLLHRDESSGLEPDLKNRRFEELPAFETCCSSSCYLLMEKNPTPSNSALGDEGISSNYNEQPHNKDEWTGCDQTTFNALITVFPNNYCAIAEAMLTKSCQQVYEHVQIAGIKPVSTPMKIELKKSNVSKYKIAQLSKNYKPCNHSGICDKKNDCLCINCEKFCYCSLDCAKRSFSCNCSTNFCTNICPCRGAQRECDPDSCSCSCKECMNAVCENCENVNIQNGIQMKLSVAPSQIHGYGVFAKEIFDKNEFIGEYTGEIISSLNITHRVRLNTETGLTYMFALNNDCWIDGRYYGSELRFLNFSNSPNCFAKIMMVNGDHRIGIYAERIIQVDEELLLEPTKPKFRK